VNPVTPLGERRRVKLSDHLAIHLQIAPDGHGRSLAAVEFGESAWIVGLAEGAIEARSDPALRAFNAAFVPGRPALVLGLRSGGVGWWEWQKPVGPELAPVKAVEVNCVAPSLDGDTLWFAGDWGGAIGSLHRPTGTLRTVRSSATAAIRSLALSADGRTLASGNSEGLVELWDVTAAE
jgi:streptogramin lyase